jgi:hypothetical protein
MKTKRSFGLLIACVVSFAFIPSACNRGGSSTPRASLVSGTVAARWFELSLELIRQTPGFSPPVASRALGYAGVTLYESIVGGMPDHRSLAGSLNGLTPPPAIDVAQRYHFGLIANAALAAIHRTLFPNAPQGTLDEIDALEQSVYDEFTAAVDTATRDRSVAHGRAVAEWIASWSLSDGGAFGYLTNASPGYTAPVGPGLWEPTPPNFAPPLQARWGENRTFVLDSGASCQPGPFPTYSTDPTSAFHAEANEVYQTVNSLTQAQLDIANFWADNPGQTATPPGHWIAILNQLVADESLSLDRCAETYCKLGVAVADSFISCWYAKFDQNLLRPITYIQANIDANWTTPIPTPPFPEYTSGHSVQSGAAAEILSDLFGENYAFTDDTHAALGYPARSFASFREAAQEAAISRLYGGIHYRAAIENGIAQGEAIGREVNALPFRGAPASAPKGALPGTFDADVATQWFDLALVLVRTTPGFSPPVASRALGYAGISLYESLQAGDPTRASLAGQLADLTMLPAPAGGLEYHWPSSANAAMARILRHLFASTSPQNLTAIDDLESSLADSLGQNVSAGTLERSRLFGRRVADAVFFWSRSDGGHEGYRRNFPSSYQPPAGPGLWVPTGPGFQAALQPYWGQNRAFALVGDFRCDPGAPPPYSELNSSLFYSQAFAVFQSVNALTQSQIDIARWWSDDPGTTATPPGHSVSMLTQVLRQTGAKLDVAAEAYARVGIAVADAFVACWWSKFHYNLLRPITYIQNVIDPNWMPLLNTPPFPEYTSGHSVQSGAWAEVMTAMFGSPFPFTDRTNEFLGYPARGFTSFFEAANEAALSRLYGGIHFSAAIELGVEQGRCVGQRVNALAFRR